MMVCALGNAYAITGLDRVVIGINDHGARTAFDVENSLCNKMAVGLRALHRFDPYAINSYHPRKRSSPGELSNIEYVVQLFWEFH